jgi:dihydropteroate synthase
MGLVRGAGRLSRELGCPVMIGTSRKRFLRNVIAASRAERVGDDNAREITLQDLDAATVASSILAIENGAHAVRVHNVSLLHAALAVYTWA